LNVLSIKFAIVMFVGLFSILPLQQYQETKW